jgi:hypothetical protein
MNLKAKNCDDCPLADHWKQECRATDRVFPLSGLPKWCPLLAGAVTVALDNPRASLPAGQRRAQVARRKTSTRRK